MSDDMIDVTRPQVVEVQISVDKKKVWVNVDGVCRFRAHDIQNFVLDGRPKSPRSKVTPDATPDNVAYAGEGDA